MDSIPGPFTPLANGWLLEWLCSSRRGASDSLLQDPFTPEIWLCGRIPHFEAAASSVGSPCGSLRSLPPPAEARPEPPSSLDLCLLPYLMVFCLSPTNTFLLFPRPLRAASPPATQQQLVCFGWGFEGTPARLEPWLPAWGRGSPHKSTDIRPYPALQGRILALPG